jgi:hypothetical protein
MSEEICRTPLIEESNLVADHSPMPRRKKNDDPLETFVRLCPQCKDYVRNIMTNVSPPHVVHPVTGEQGVYDSFGQAKCPNCKALWFRGPQGIKLIAVP